MKTNIVSSCFLFCIVSNMAVALTLKNNYTNSSLLGLKPIFNKLIPIQSTIVPIGAWGEEDFKFLCDMDLSVSMNWNPLMPKRFVPMFYFHFYGHHFWWSAKKQRSHVDCWLSTIHPFWFMFYTGWLHQNRRGKRRTQSSE